MTSDGMSGRRRTVDKDDIKSAPLDADIIQCRAELKEFKEKLVNCKSCDSPKVPNQPQSKLKTIEVKPLKKKLSKQIDERLKSIAFDRTHKSCSPDLSKDTDLNLATESDLQKKIQQRLIDNDDSTETNNIPTFDLNRQLLADRRKLSSTRRTKNTANTIPSLKRTKKKGIEAVIESSIVSQPLASSNKTNSTSNQNDEITEAGAESSTEEIFSSVSLAASHLQEDETLAILAQELESAIKEDKHLDESITQDSTVNSQDSGIFMLSANEILEHSRITQEERDMLESPAESGDVIEIDLTTKKANPNICLVGSPKKHKTTPSEKPITNLHNNAGNRYTYFDQADNNIDSALSQIVSADIKAIRFFPQESESKIVRYAG